jgi:hypothetical protein
MKKFFRDSIHDRIEEGESLSSGYFLVRGKLIEAHHKAHLTVRREELELPRAVNNRGYALP